MGTKKTDQERFEEIADDARESFDLGDFLRGRSVQTDEVRVYTDEVTAKARGGYETYQETIAEGINVPRVRSWGLVSKLAEAQEELEKLPTKTSKAAKELKTKIDGLNAEIEVLTKSLLDSSLDIELKSVPKVIKKDSYRAAKKALGIHGKIREADYIDMIDEQDAQLLTRCVIAVTQHGSRKRNERLTIEAARDLMNFLPDSEWEKVKAKLDELLLRKVISDQVTADRDF